MMETETWAPLVPAKCGECGRFAPDWYNERDEHIADSLGQVSSRRIAKAYGISEQRVREIGVQVLGKRAYIDRILLEDGWGIETSP